MDKSRKLQRYSRKDYTEVVEFPVEIVGRDGVVRRYSFEDSIRLYQRRVTFASIRYRDREIVDAEIEHCESRIEQLRRSYFHRNGWGTPAGGTDPMVEFGSLAGEVAAFLCRVLRVDGRPDISVAPIDTDDSAIGCYSVRPLRSEAQLTLWVHTFTVGDPRRDAFFEQLKRIESGDNPAERLLAFHHTADCGFVMSASAADIDVLERWQAEEEPWHDDSPSPLDGLADTVRLKDLAAVVAMASAMTSEQPWDLAAYTVGGAAAANLSDGILAEEFGLIGSRYFEDDAFMHYLVAAGRIQQGRYREAVEHARRAFDLEPDDIYIRRTLAYVLVQSGDLREASAVMGWRLTQDPVLARLRVVVLGRTASAVVWTLGVMALVGYAWVSTSVGAVVAALLAFGLGTSSRLVWPIVQRGWLPFEPGPVSLALNRARAARKSVDRLS